MEAIILKTIYQSSQNPEISSWVGSAKSSIGGIQEKHFKVGLFQLPEFYPAFNAANNNTRFKYLHRIRMESAKKNGIKYQSLEYIMEEYSLKRSNSFIFREQQLTWDNIRIGSARLQGHLK